jgi:streptomycin 6-kinase
MKPDDFVKAVFDYAYRSGVQSVIEVLEDPPGRRPRPELLRLSTWYLSLSDPEKSMVDQIMRHSADAAIFGLLAMVDGERVFDDDHSDIVIRVGDAEVSKDGDLHEIFRALVDADEYPESSS